MPKKNTKKQLKRIAKKLTKPIPIMFRQKQLTTCCEGYKSGSAFTIPFGFADRLGTQRLPVAPQNITNIYNQHIPNVPVAPVAPFKPKVRIPQYIPAEKQIPIQGVKEVPKPIIPVITPPVLEPLKPISLPRKIPIQGVKETLPEGMFRNPRTGELHQGPIINEQGYKYMPINVPLMSEPVTIGQPFEITPILRPRKIKPKKIQVEEIQIPVYA